MLLKLPSHQATAYHLLRTADTVFPETPVLGVGKSEQLLINKVFFYCPGQGLSYLSSFPF